jgi:hypothetical protein
MDAASKDSGAGGNTGEVWRAEEAIAGNRKALQALREIVAFPFLYARESRILGLKVSCPLLSRPCTLHPQVTSQSANPF